MRKIKVLAISALVVIGIFAAPQAFAATPAGPPDGCPGGYYCVFDGYGFTGNVSIIPQGRTYIPWADSRRIKSTFNNTAPVHQIGPAMCLYFNRVHRDELRNTWSNGKGEPLYEQGSQPTNKIYVGHCV